MKYVVWDWNGTLLDDVLISIECMNVLLRQYKLKELMNKEEYRNRFCFPVEQYYQNLGFYFSAIPFTVLANEFMGLYRMKSKQCNLNNGVIEVIDIIRYNGLKQIVLSASNKNILAEQVAESGISLYFDKILGIEDNYAKTKIEVAKKWKNENSILGTDIVMVGDTYHDYEVSETLGCSCILYSSGHQRINTDIYHGAKVAAKFENILDYIMDKD